MGAGNDKENVAIFASEYLSRIFDLCDIILKKKNKLLSNAITPITLDAPAFLLLKKCEL